MIDLLEKGVRPPDKNDWMTAYEIEGHPDLHLTHHYFRDLSLAQVGHILKTMKEHFKKNPLQSKAVSFTQQELFGPEKDIQVLVNDQLPPHLDPELKSQLQQHYPSRYPSYRPHITSDLPEVTGKIKRFYFQRGDGKTIYSVDAKQNEDKIEATSNNLNKAGRSAMPTVNAKVENIEVKRPMTGVAMQQTGVKNTAPVAGTSPKVPVPPKASPTTGKMNNMPTQPKPPLQKAEQPIEHKYEAIVDLHNGKQLYFRHAKGDSGTKDELIQKAKEVGGGANGIVHLYDPFSGRHISSHSIHEPPRFPAAPATAKPAEMQKALPPEAKHNFQIGDQVTIHPEGLKQHSRTVPSHMGMAQAMQDWRNDLSQLQSKNAVGKITRVFPGSDNINVDFGGKTYGVGSYMIQKLQKAAPVAPIGQQQQAAPSKPAQEQKPAAIDYSKFKRPTYSTSGSVPPLHNPLQHSQGALQGMKKADETAKLEKLRKLRKCAALKKEMPVYMRD